MLTLTSTLWRHLLGRWPIYRMARQNGAKSVISPLRTELLNDYLLRDLGLPRGHTDARLPRL